MASFNFRTVTSRFNELVYQYPIRIPERYSLVIRSLLTQVCVCEGAVCVVRVCHSYPGALLPVIRSLLTQVCVDVQCLCVCVCVDVDVQCVCVCVCAVCVCVCVCVCV